MRILPWRVKAFLSNHFRLAYHLAVNFGARGNSADHWDRMLEDSWDDPSRAWPTKAEMIAALTRPEMKILDVACGNGSILRAPKRQGVKYLHAFEISGYAVSGLKTEGIDARRGILPRIDFAHHQFDLVIASQVLEHVVRRGRFLKEIRRVLKPGGRVLIFVPDRCLGPIDEPEPVIVYDAHRLERFLGHHFNEVNVKSMHDANHQMPILFANARTAKTISA